MLAAGNGDKKTCVNNLLLIVRGEVCYDRIRGLDPKIVDRPAADAADEFQQDALWMLKTYEPRANIQGIQVTRDDTANGGFSVTAKIT